MNTWRISHILMINCLKILIQSYKILKKSPRLEITDIPELLEE